MDRVEELLFLPASGLKYSPPPQHILNLMSVYVLLWIVIIIYLECKHPLVFSVLQ